MQFITTHLRVVHFGRHTKRLMSTIRQFRADHPMRAYVNNWLTSRKAQVTCMGFEGGVADQATRFSTRPLILTHPPTSSVSAVDAVARKWFYSSARMGGVTGYLICRDMVQPHSPIIGMQFKYAGGGVAAIGQFRFDKSLESTTEMPAGGKSRSPCLSPLPSPLRALS